MLPREKSDMSFCVVPKCTFYHRKDDVNVKSTYLLQHPKLAKTAEEKRHKERLLQLLIEVCGYMPSEVLAMLHTDRAKICESHFLSEDMEIHNNQRWLKCGALPVLNMPKMTWVMQMRLKYMKSNRRAKHANYTANYLEQMESVEVDGGHQDCILIQTESEEASVNDRMWDLVSKLQKFCNLLYGAVPDEITESYADEYVSIALEVALERMECDKTFDDVEIPAVFDRTTSPPVVDDGKPPPLKIVTNIEPVDGQQKFICTLPLTQDSNVNESFSHPVDIPDHSENNLISCSNKVVKNTDNKFTVNIIAGNQANDQLGFQNLKFVPFSPKKFPESEPVNNVPKVVLKSKRKTTIRLLPNCAPTSTVPADSQHDDVPAKSMKKTRVASSNKAVKKGNTNVNLKAKKAERRKAALLVKRSLSKKQKDSAAANAKEGTVDNKRKLKYSPPEEVAFYQQYKIDHEEWGHAYKCPKCGICFKKWHYLKWHDKKIHLMESLKICTVCGKSVKGMKEHMVVHTNERNYKCEICGARFLQRSHLNTHKVQVTACTFPSFECNLCNAQFMAEDACADHFKVEHLNKKIICDLCGDEVCEKCVEDKHQVTLLKLYKCKFCEETFTFKLEYKTHLRESHGSLHPSPSLLRIKAYGNQATDFLCEYCPKTFNNVKSLRAHMRKKHIDNTVNDDDPEKQTRRRTRTARSKKPKQPIPVEELTCEFCSIVFKNKKCHKAHMKRKHVLDIAITSEIF